MPPKHQRNCWLLRAENVSGMMPLPNDWCRYRPDHPAFSNRSEASASSVMHHSSQPRSPSSALRRIRPMVPAKMMELRSLRDGIEVAKKYR